MNSRYMWKNIHPSLFEYNSLLKNHNKWYWLQTFFLQASDNAGTELYVAPTPGKSSVIIYFKNIIGTYTARLYLKIYRLFSYFTKLAYF